MIPCNYRTNPEPVAQIMKYKVPYHVLCMLSQATVLHFYETTLCIIPLLFACVFDCGINFATTQAILSLEIWVA